MEGLKNKADRLSLLFQVLDSRDTKIHIQNKPATKSIIKFYLTARKRMIDVIKLVLLALPSNNRLLSRRKIRSPTSQAIYKNIPDGPNS